MRTRVIPLTGLLALTGVLTVGDVGKGRSQQPVPDFLQKMPAPAGRPAAEDSSALVREFLVTPQVGPWMICVTSYSGPEAARMAREFVLVLRDPAGPYKMRAYVFNRGAEERQKERERVEQYKQQMRDKYKQIGVEMPAKIRVPRTAHIEDQCAVWVGGFKDMASARRYLDVIKKFDTPDPQKVKMDSAFIADLKSKKAQGAYINPFKRCFVVPNPTAPPPAVTQNTAPDPFLKDLNANERFSLLKCPRPYTLLVKQFQGAALVQSESGGGGVFGKLGPAKGGVDGQTLDKAGLSAHNMAELLSNPKLGLNEVYVLHQRDNSMVTVGSFDGEKDPRLQQTLQRWQSLMQQIPPDTLARLQLLGQPLPMIVPRPK